MEVQSVPVRVVEKAAEKAAEKAEAKAAEIEAGGPDKEAKAAVETTKLIAAVMLNPRALNQRNSTQAVQICSPILWAAQRPKERTAKPQLLRQSLATMTVC
jgi:hypothetical protein